MANQAIRVVATITGRPDKAPELKALLVELVRPTRAEPGCVSYEVCQSTDDPAQFVCIEQWANAEAIDSHMKSAHVQAAFARAGSLLSGPPQIRTYARIA